MLHTVKLNFFNDDATGEWGLAHDNSIDVENPFNAFWNGIGIFHDVFEHWFEGNHKYFMDENAFNVGGEMTAMGSAMYYYFTLGIGRTRLLNQNSWYSFDQSIIQTTFSEIQESISEGYCRYGNTLNSGVPYQKDTEDYNFESMLGEYEYQLDELKNKPLNKDNFNDDIEFEFAKDYRKSVTKAKVRNLHRYGYKLASKLVPDNNENRHTLIEFIEFWTDFCAKNSAEELAVNFKGLEFTIDKDKDGIISWKGELISNDYFIDDVEIKPLSNGYIPDVEDIMLEAYQEEIY